MQELLRIGDIAFKYQISSRTLRYYEEIGLLSSIRKNDTQYRYYGQGEIYRLEQILILRKLGISLKDILEIFRCGDITKAIKIFEEKQKIIKNSISDLSRQHILINKFISLLTQKGFNKLSGLDVISETSRELQKMQIGEEQKMNSNKPGVLQDDQVRIIKLKPQKVAWYRTDGPEPEMKAWKVMLEWIRKNGIDNIPTTRYFGFNNPNPSPETPDYGYEVWITVSDEIKKGEGIGIKSYSGGLFAVINTDITKITENWEKLSNWVKGSKYSIGEWQWLEEHLIADESSWEIENLQIDLYFPIADIK